MTAAVRSLAIVLFAVGCAGRVDPDGPGAAGGSTWQGSADGGVAPSRDDFGNVDPSDPRTDLTGVEPPTPNPDAFWADDPPPMECLEDGTMRTVGEPPGGTLECPSDKNREGCVCDTIGETAACWPGLRANRNRGICTDGVTTCNEYPEFGGVWGPCEGYILPDAWATTGPGACRCFAEGTWEIDNLSPCFWTDSTTKEVFATSTVIVDPETGMSDCPGVPTLASGEPPPVPPSPWSTSRISVDCPGRYELCYAVKAGDRDNPSPDDCTLVQVCVETWYEPTTPGAPQELPLLPAWSSDDSDCALEFQLYGGYGEMTVQGLSVECDVVDDGDGHPYPFDRRRYCPVACSDDPTLPECQNCAQGGSGEF